jgi:hypothetical protein
MRMENREWRMASRRSPSEPATPFKSCRRLPQSKSWRMTFDTAFHEASWSAVAERSGDTAFAPPVPLRDASPWIARVSRALFGVSPKSSVPGLQTPQVQNPSTLQQFNASTIQRSSRLRRPPGTAPRESLKNALTAPPVPAYAARAGKLSWNRHQIRL